MKFRIGVLATAMLLIISTQLLRAQHDLQSWETIKLDSTTESRILYKFGVPDSVEIEMGYDEFQVFRSRASAFDWWYTFKYLPIRDNVPILDGPLGHADVAEISFSSSTGKVVQVAWEYYRRLSPQAIQEALGTEIEMKQVGMVQVGKKKSRNGDLFVTVSAPKFNETNVMLAIPTTQD